MNAKTTFQVYDDQNKPVYNTVRFNLTDCIKLADAYHLISNRDYTVQDITSDYFTKQMYSTIPEKIIR